MVWIPTPWIPWIMAQGTKMAMNHEQDQSHYSLVNIQKAIEHGHGNSGFVCLPGRVIWGGLLRVSFGPTICPPWCHSKPIGTPSQTGDVDRQTSCDRFSPSTTSTQFEQQGAGLDLQVPSDFIFCNGEKNRGNKYGGNWHSMATSTIAG